MQMFPDAPHVVHGTKSKLCDVTAAEHALVSNSSWVAPAARQLCLKPWYMCVLIFCTVQYNPQIWVSRRLLNLPAARATVSVKHEMLGLWA